MHDRANRHQTDATVPDSGPDADYFCDVVLPCGFPSGVGVVGCDVVLEAPDGAAMGSVYGCVLLDASCALDAATPTGPVNLSCPCDAFLPTRGAVRSAAVARRPSAPARRSARPSRGWPPKRRPRSTRSSTLPTNLARLGAPTELVGASVAAARDEVRHARIMTRLAARHGATPPPIRGRRRAPATRGLAAVARENAVEGCVRETFAALLARRQSLRASNPELRRAFAAIAADETRHAALSWAVARWAESALDDAARAKVERARRAAIQSVRRELTVEPPAELARDAGFPRRDEARALLAAFASAIATPPCRSRSRRARAGR